MALARCLLRDKPILLLDEPFSALDQKLRVEMLALIAKLCDEKDLTLLLVTHQPSELIGSIDQVLVVENGQISQLQKGCKISFIHNVELIVSTIYTSSSIKKV